MKTVIFNKQLNKTNLWNGCILASVAHAMMVTHYPELAYEHSWDGDNYSVVYDSGGRGTISFKDHYVVGAFRNDNVTRTDMFTPLDFFTGAPENVRNKNLLGRLNKKMTTPITIAILESFK